MTVLADLRHVWWYLAGSVAVAVYFGWLAHHWYMHHSARYIDTRNHPSAEDWLPEP